MAHREKFKGTIVEVDASGGIAIVHLENSVCGHDEAVISANTAGHSVLMNGKGELEPQTVVEGTGITGIDAIVATHVVKVN